MEGECETRAVVGLVADGDMEGNAAPVSCPSLAPALLPRYVIELSLSFDFGATRQSAPHARRVYS